jgi:hypothetical protein
VKEETMSVDKLTKSFLFAIVVLLSVIAFQNFSRMHEVHAATGKTYQYKLVDLTPNDEHGECKWNLSQANHDGGEGWQIVGMSSGSYGDSWTSGTQVCYWGLAIR